MHLIISLYVFGNSYACLHLEIDKRISQATRLWVMQAMAAIAISPLDGCFARIGTHVASGGDDEPVLCMAGRSSAVKQNPYADPDIAELYDVLNTWAESDDFYLARVMTAQSVLDLGCGTGMILRTARKRGHTGRLVGPDPAREMLDVARRDRADIEWTRGDLTTRQYNREFDLVFISGHAFQELVSDEELHQNLDAVRSSLTGTGLLIVFAEEAGDIADWWT